MRAVARRQLSALPNPHQSRHSQPRQKQSAAALDLYRRRCCNARHVCKRCSMHGYVGRTVIAVHASTYAIALRTPIGYMATGLQGYRATGLQGYMPL